MASVFQETATIYEPQRFLFCSSPFLYSERWPQFKSPNGFYSVYDQMYSQCAVCGFQRFLFCLSPYLFSGWHIVPQLYIQIKLSRVHSRKALSECKASRRLGKQMRCLSRFLSKAHSAAPHNIQGSYNSLSSVFRLLLIEAITFPFHRQKSKYSLSISLSPRSIFCNSRLLRNFLLSPSTLYGPTL